MKIYNTKNITDFEDTLKEIKSRLNIEIDFNSISSNCYRVKLVKKKENKNYQRTGYLISIKIIIKLGIKI